LTRTITRERIPHTDPRLRRMVHHDSESRRYEHDTTGLSIVSAKHTRRIEVLDQGQVGSCTGTAGVGCLGTDPIYDSLMPSKVLTVEVDGARYASRSRTLPRYTLDEAGAAGLLNTAGS
jgi:hypothetical protein